MKTLFCVHEAANKKKKTKKKSFVLLQRKKNKLRPPLEVQRTLKECVRGMIAEFLTAFQAVLITSGDNQRSFWGLAQNKVVPKCTRDTATATAPP